MLKIGSIVGLNDNSGAFNLKILNYKKKKTFKTSYAKVSDIVVGVIKDHNIYKKKLLLKSKDKVNAIIVCTKKKYSKKNGIFISFSKNRCIPLKITRFIVPVASWVYTPVFYELRYFKKFKVISKLSKNF